MKIARVQKKDGAICYGILKEDQLILIEDNIFEVIKETGEIVRLSDVKLLAPVAPQKVLCVGLNYRDHAEEMNLAIPDLPNIFMKPSTSVQNPFDPVIYPEKYTNEISYECELVIVIGKKAKNVPADQASDYILGYTCGNDVTARNYQSPANQWSYSKGFDTFMPLGPWIETDCDPRNLDIKTLINGEVRQTSNTKNLIFDVSFLAEHLSRAMTLLPGDVISTGTPSGVGLIRDGDVMEICIENIGSLKNPLAKI